MAATTACSSSPSKSPQIVPLPTLASMDANIRMEPGVVPVSNPGESFKQIANREINEALKPTNRTFKGLLEAFSGDASMLTIDALLGAVESEYQTEVPYYGMGSWKGIDYTAYGTIQEKQRANSNGQPVDTDYRVQLQEIGIEGAGALFFNIRRSDAKVALVYWDGKVFVGIAVENEFFAVQLPVEGENITVAVSDTEVNVSSSQVPDLNLLKFTLPDTP